MKGLWTVYFKDHTKYLQHSDAGLRKVGVLGHENKGKSWILGKVMGYTLPHGFHTQTTGLCMLYPPGNIPWAGLDTPGTNTPVRMNRQQETLGNFYEKLKVDPEEISRRMLADNQQIGTLLQSFIIEKAELLLIVVGKLEISDQVLLNKLYSEKAIQKKKVIVVHNLMNSYHVSDVEKIIKSDIDDCIQAKKLIIYIEDLHKKGKVNDVVYVEQLSGIENKDFRPVHIFMAHEGSKAGDFYNKVAIRYIRDTICVDTHDEKFDMVKEFLEFFNAKKSLYLASQDEKSTLPEVKLLSTNDRGLPTGIGFGDDPKIDIKKASVDQLLQVKTLDTTLKQPPFTIRMVSMDGKNGLKHYLMVETEVNGAVDDRELKTEYKSYGDDQIKIEISGKVTGPFVRDEEASSNTILQNTRTFTKFNVTSEGLKLGNLTINNTVPPTFSQREGLLIVAWNLVEKYNSPCPSLLTSQYPHYG